jgi:hypothetical protein
LHPPDEESRSIEARAVDCLGALAIGLSDAMQLAMRRSTDATDFAVEALLWMHRFPELRNEDLRVLLGTTHSTALRLVSEPWPTVSLSVRATGRIAARSRSGRRRSGRGEFSGS